MNLRELNAGSVAEKAWLAPVVGSLSAGSVDCEEFEIDGRFVESIAFAQTANASNTANTNEVNTFGTGEGSLTVPAGYFVAGSVGSLKFQGIVSNAAADRLTLRLYGGATGNVLLCSASVLSFGISTNKGIFGEFNFIVRHAGIGGVAFIQTNGVFSQGVNVDNILISGTGSSLVVAGFSTVGVNQFRLTSEWSQPTGALQIENLVLSI
jgi:hypothetical protein